MGKLRGLKKLSAFLRERVDGNIVEGRYRPSIGLLRHHLLQLDPQRSIFPGFQPWGQTEGTHKSTVNVHYRDIGPDEVDVGNLKRVVASLVNGAEDPGMLVDESFTTVELLSDDVGEAAVFRIVRGEAFRVTTVPGVGFTLDDSRNVRLIPFALRKRHERYAGSQQ